MNVIANSYTVPSVLGDIIPYTPNFQATNTQKFGQIFAAELGNIGGSVTTDSVISELESLGVSVTVRAVANNNKAVNRHVETVGGGWNSVTIAPNILERMLNDADVRQKYIDKVREWQDVKIPDILSKPSLHGGRPTSMTMIIHEDGTVTYVLAGRSNNEIEKNGDSDEKEQIYLETSNYAYRLEEQTDNNVYVSAINENVSFDDNKEHFIAPYVAGLVMQSEAVRINRPQAFPTNVNATSEFGVLETRAITPTTTDISVQLSEENHKLPYKFANIMLSDSITRLYQRSLK